MIEILKRYENRLLITFGILLALALRYTLFDFASRDYLGFFTEWYDFIVENGGFRALGHKFANYNPPYLYMMVLVIYLFPALPKIVAMKVISVTFDLILSFFVYKLIRLQYPKSIERFYGLMAFLFAPTVFLNSAFWGQADAIYTTGLIACVYWLCSDRPWLAMSAFGFAFAVKAQAMFLAPLILVLLIKKRLSWKQLLVVPLIYVFALLPAWLAGRSFISLALIYVHQSALYHELTKNAPTFYTFFPNSAFEYLYPAGLILAFVVSLLLVVGVSKSRRLVNHFGIVQFAFVSVVSVVFFLPKMHDRYFYPADVLSIVYAFYFPRYFFVPVAVIFCSLISYLPYLFDVTVPLPILSAIMGVVIMVCVRHLIQEFREEPVSS